MHYILYGFYNLVYLVGSLWALFFANVYLNGIFIPDSFRWKNGGLREDMTLFGVSQFVLLIVEGIILVLLIYFMNRWYLNNIAKAENSDTIAMWTGGLFFAIELAFTILLVIWSYR